MVEVLFDAGVVVISNDVFALFFSFSLAALSSSAITLNFLPLKLKLTAFKGLFSSFLFSDSLSVAIIALAPAIFFWNSAFCSGVNPLVNSSTLCGFVVGFETTGFAVGFVDVSETTGFAVGVGTRNFLPRKSKETAVTSLLPPFISSDNKALAPFVFSSNCAFCSGVNPLTNSS